MSSRFSLRVAMVSFGFKAGKKGSLHIYDDHLEFRFAKKSVVPFSSIVNIEEESLVVTKKYKLHFTGGGEFVFSIQSIDPRKKAALRTVFDFILAKEPLPQFDPYGDNLPVPMKPAAAKKRSGGTVFQGGERM